MYAVLWLRPIAVSQIPQNYCERSILKVIHYIGIKFQI